MKLRKPASMRGSFLPRMKTSGSVRVANEVADTFSTRMLFYNAAPASALVPGLMLFNTQLIRFDQKDAFFPGAELIAPILIHIHGQSITIPLNTVYLLS
jgi:hypothetical protein